MPQPLPISEIARRRERDAKRNSLAISPPNSQAAACRERYGTPAQFNATFAPATVYAHCGGDPLRLLPRIYFGNAPKLQTLIEAYGQGFAETWIAAHLALVAENSDQKEKPTPEQYEDAARTVLAKHACLNAAEFQLFILRYKTADYGKRYFALDCALLAEALNKFREQRNAEMWKIDQEDERRAKEEAERRDAAAAAEFREKMREQGLTPSERHKSPEYRAYLKAEAEKEKNAKSRPLTP
jgi:hypothetical protein